MRRASGESFCDHRGIPSHLLAEAVKLTTFQASEAADFPRTALISIASVSVIMVIAVVVFCVFRCRQSPPPGDHYPMVSFRNFRWCYDLFI